MYTLYMLLPPGELPRCPCFTSLHQTVFSATQGSADTLSPLPGAEFSYTPKCWTFRACSRCFFGCNLHKLTHKMLNLLWGLACTCLSLFVCTWVYVHLCVHCCICVCVSVCVFVSVFLQGRFRCQLRFISSTVCSPLLRSNRVLSCCL